jgi:hypothetical protein
VDKYPIQVKIEAHVGDQKLEVFRCRQQDLFRKNGAKRTKTIADIQASLKDLKEDFDLE